MKTFMNEDFLLENEPARILFHDWAQNMPIFDYHCHLSPKEIAQNKREPNITDAWLGGDHYKWRMIRANGMNEKDGDSFQRFLNWSDTVSRLAGNPLYHWTHLELKRYFGIDKPLSPSTAREIYDEANAKLQSDPSLDVYGIFNKFNVYAVGTTDDPIDSLEYHSAIRKEAKTTTKVIPSFRPDKAINIESDGFGPYIKALSGASGVKIENAWDVMEALSKRLDHFVENGCLATDHSIAFPPFVIGSDSEVNAVFQKAMKGEAVSAQEAEMYKTYILVSLAKEYSKRGLVMQLHLQASRNNCTKGYKTLGPDSGFDAISDYSIANKLSRLFDTLDVQDALPKTILYSLNPKDYYVLAPLMGCFQRDIPGKLQLGSAWWFCDHIDGMVQQMKTLASVGMLSRFVGMLTDSRSFLSYPRHEYFRRIVCNILGTWMENGEVSNDFEMMGKMAQDISFNNALSYF